jgi:hypothetical protein
MTDSQDRKSVMGIIDQMIGRPLSWVAGKPAPGRERARGRGSLIDAALGEVLSWTGLAGKRHGRRRP